MAINYDHKAKIKYLYHFTTVKFEKLREILLI